MDIPVNRVLEAAVVRILRPLAQVLIRHGMAEGSFAQLARQAFVEAGFDHMARSGNRPTVSGVAALTGLSRKEVARLAKADPGGDRDSRERYNRAVRVISGWVNDARYQASGEPAALRTDGEEPSFATLVREYSGDVPPAAMLTVLQDGGNVVVEAGVARLVQRAYIPMQTAPDRLNILGTDVAELILTIAHNISAEPSDRLFQRKVSSTTLRADAVQAFREYSNARSQELLEEYDSWLAEREVAKDSQPEESTAYVAVGIYYSETSDQKEK